jgi:predicted NUDIX family NTP pyrophosphohydrolase
MKVISCGLLMYREKNGNVEFFLIHPGGPYFKNKDKHSWGVPKGRKEDSESYLECAKREFIEETGFTPDSDYFIKLGYVKQNKKDVHVWAFKTQAKKVIVRSNEFEMEWPPKSGEIKNFPEVDDGRFFSVDEAYEKILPSQRGILDRMVFVLTGNKK